MVSRLPRPPIGVRGLALCAAVLACDEPDRQVTRQLAQRSTSSPRAVMAREIMADTQRARYAVSVDTSKIQIEAERSTIVPAVTYHRGVYYVALDAPIELVVASRSDTTVLIAGIEDWWALLGGWRPRDAGEARQACLEMVRVTRDPWFGLQPVYFHRDSLSSPGLADHQKEFLRQRDLPVATARAIGDSVWEVSGWMVRPTLSRLATRYRCRLPASGQRGIPDVTELDSIPIWEAGLPPTR